MPNNLEYVYLVLGTTSVAAQAGNGVAVKHTQSEGTGVLCIKNLSLHSAAAAAVRSLLCCMNTRTSMVVG